MPSRPETLVELLRERALHQPDKLAYSFLSDGDGEETHLSYQELDRQARSIAAWLQALESSGERALLLYPPGLAYIAAFFGCLHAGVIAVPAYPPRLNRTMRMRLRAIVADAQPTIALTTTSIIANIERHFEQAPELKALRWLNTDHTPEGIESDWQPPSVSPDTLAFLQYTSGSTGTPKGVMLSHGNLMHNLAVIRHGFQIDQGDLGVFWLPSYHDMGLIGGILEPMYVGGPSALMSPGSFLQRPARWLEAITRLRGTVNGAPTFAYDLCVDKIAPEQRSALDLSTWRVAFCGAEPVRRETLERFAEAFVPCGFRPEAFYPCYGLAEASLLVSGASGPALAVTRTVQRKALEAGRVVAANEGAAGTQRLVSCGRSLLDQKILIVEPEARTACPPGAVGEIWVSGRSIAGGYWNRPEETQGTFQAYTADTGEGPFLRTGDLGFFHEGELFITGRLKDLIIIHGRNLCPQDIELTVERSHPALRRGSGAAFSAGVEGRERLIIVQEVERQHRNPNADGIVGAIRRAVAEEHELELYAIALVKALSIPKTSSGKIQRHACRAGFLDGTLEVVAEWRANIERRGGSMDGVRPLEDVVQARPHLAAKAIESWLVSRISKRLGLSPEAIDVGHPFVYYGLDSVHAVGLAGELQAWLGRPVAPTLAWDYPTIESLSRHLANRDGTTAEDQPRPMVGASPRSDAPVAVVGLGCRFPGASNPEAFWQLLKDGVDAITEVPADRWDVDAFYDPDPAAPGKLNTRWGGFVDGIDRFDPGFFGISPREAARMDPQQRLLLEVAWEALEDAGVAPDRLAGTPTGVFVGISSFDYSTFQFDDPVRVDAYAGTGNAHSIVANRLSYLLDLRGPSVALDTACSSSLVAVHLACQSLRTGESDLAIAGGVNVLLRPELTIAFSQARMMAADGRCKTFDAHADGYVRGEGCGVVILKRLSDALRDGDRVLAAIRGSALNQDGRSNGLTAPNGPAQQAVIRRALTDAGVAPAEIGYVETHGTGTPLGDPIEFEALKAVLMPGRSLDRPCALGSVKTNIGHLEAAAGVAGLIKAVLALQHGEIPPHLHLNELNHHIALDGTPFSIPTRRQLWPANGSLRLAGVSSFGFGGTNAHVVLEGFEPPRAFDVPEVPTDGAAERPLHLLTLSAQGETPLRALAAKYAGRPGDGGRALANGALPDLCFTANVGRSHFAHRLAVLAGSEEELREKLRAFVGGEDVPGLFRGSIQNRKRPKVAFLFTGQGSQYPDMGRRLYETQPTFRTTLDQCDALLRPHLEQPLLGVLYPPPGTASPLDQTAYTQPALFALEYALAELWRSWGIEPEIVLGHSVGEYVAACVAGAFSLKDGLELIAKRGRLMQALPSGGAMAAVFADDDRVKSLLDSQCDRVSIAALNGPENTVLSGEGEALRLVLTKLESEGIKAQPLTVSHAFHSPLMEPMLSEFEQVASRLRFAPLLMPLVSNLTGQTMESGTVLEAGYWRRHVRESVRFAPGMQSLAAQGVETFVEIGPHPVLSGMGRHCLPGEGGTWLPSLKRDRDDWQVMLTALAALYLRGTEVNWAGVDRDYARRKVALPTYPFARERFWIGPSEPERHSRRRDVGSEETAAPGQDEGRFNVADWLYEQRWLPRSRPDQSLLRPAPDYIPTPRQIADALRPRVTELRASPDVRLYEDLSAELDRLSATYVLQALRQLGLELRAGQRLSFEPLIEHLGIAVRHGRLVHRLLEILQEDGILIPMGVDWDVCEIAEREDPQAHWARLLEQYPAGEPELKLLGRSGPRLAELLRGQVDPLQVLFPDGSLTTAEALYQDSISFRAYNQLVQESIARALADLPSGRAAHVLEIGAGTGGTTAHVLPRLPADCTEYLLTDVSAVFLGRAEQKFRDYPFVRAQLLDIELDPEAQGLAPHQFDVILAANVLHATHDLREALEHVRRLLAPEGLLVLLEGTQPVRWVDLVFGLTEGWWKFADLDVRPTHPLLAVRSWLGLLKEAGFEETAFLPEDSGPRELSPQAVIVARGPKVKWTASDVSSPLAKSPGLWLVFADRHGIGRELAEALARNGEPFLLVSSGDRFERLGTNHFQINPAQPADMAQLFEAGFRARDESCRGVLHLWSMDAEINERTSSATLECLLLAGCGSVLHLLRELNRAGWLDRLPLWLVTRGAQPVDGHASPLAAAQAPLWGMGRVIAQEHPGLRPRLVDLDPNGSVRAAFTSLWEELRGPVPDGENQVAFRYGQRYALRLRRKAPSAASGQSYEWRRDGTYLITGGLGDLGLAVARWMVEQGARRLILLGRTMLPPRRRWNRRNGDGAPPAHVAAVRELEALGASVHLAPADVADERQLKAFLTTFHREGWPPIRGVLHLAGVVEDRTLLDLDWAAFDAVLRPKVLGGWHLHRLLKDDPLELFVMFSSAGTLLGQIGQANYAAANAFLDGLAHYRRARDRPALTLNWGAWDGLGFATSAGGRRLIKRLALQGIQSLPPKGALQALDQLLRDDSAQVTVLPIDWEQFRRSVPAGAEPPLLARLAREAAALAQAGAAGSSRGLTREALLAAGPEQRAPMLEAYLAERVARVLGLPPSALDIGQPLDSLGLDSLMAVEVKNRVEGELGLSVPMVLFLQGPRIADLAAKVLRQLTTEDGASSPAPLVKAEPGLTEYPLSYGQRSMWFLNQLAPESAAYNVVFPAYIHSVLDHAALGRAFQTVLDRHPVLRTTLHVRAGRAVQVIQPHLAVHFVETDVSNWSPAKVDEFLREQVHTPFELERGPVMRVNLLSRSAEEHVLLLIVHHIAIDFWSLVGLIDELGRLYAAEVARYPASLPPLEYRYVDFVRWQTDMLAGPEGEQLWAYWQKQLAGELPSLNLPSDRPRPPAQTYDGNLLKRTVPEALVRQLRGLAMAESTTLNMLLVAAFQLLLHRYTDQTDILLGTLATGRSRAEFESTVGYFVNPVVLRADLAGNPPFKTLLAQVRQTVLAALEHEDAPFPMLVERLQPARDASRTPLFQVMFIMLQPRHLEQQGVSQFFMGETGARMKLGGVEFESFSLEQRTAMFDLTLTMVDAGGSLSAHWNYNRDLFDAATIERMAQHLERLLEGVVTRPDAPLLDLPLLGAGERRQLIVDWNRTEVDLPLDLTFIQLFEAQVARTADAAAAVFKGESLSYDQLNRRANRLAHFLEEHGVGPDVVVGLLAERGLDFLIGVLAVFKAGGAYLPLDALHPAARHAEILAQSQSPLILATGEYIPRLAQALELLPTESRPAVWQIEPLLDGGVGQDPSLPDAESGEANPPARSSPADLAYVIFTSGSTGLPKGAMVEQRGMLNHLYAKITELGLAADDVVAETASQCFDISVWQFLAGLLVGGRVHVFEDEIAHDPVQLLDGCERAQVTILETVPSLLRAMLETLSRDGPRRSAVSTLRWMIPTGEALPPELARQWLTLFPHIPILNAFGPTECSDDVAHYPIHAPPAPHVARTPIGRPIPNMRLYVLDSRHQPVPIGVPGELYVGGIGVGRGYLNDPTRTAEAFVADPFSTEPGARLYKSGDLARFLPDGNLEFLGRMDHQVKIRGFRIELGEIEAVLSRHPAVRGNVVVAREATAGAAADKRMVAYVVPHPEAACTVEELRDFLRQRLPEYMVPSAVVFLEELPLTPNGKIDRRALPAPEGGRSEIERAYVAPRTPIEEALAKLWASILGVERVGTQDNFFQLGGDSILALQTIARATEMGLRFTPKQLLQCQTIAELAAVANTAPVVQAEQGLVTGPVPLTPIQHWFFERELPEPHHYNQALLLEVHEPLDAAMLEGVLQALVRHHDALRIRFVRDESGWRQTGAEPDDAPIVSNVDLSQLAEADQKVGIEGEAALVQTRLNLSEGPLLRAVLFDLGPDRSGRLLLVAHHLAVDAVSWRILLEDLYVGYAQFRQGQVVQLPPKTTSFEHWAHKLVEYAQSAALRDDLDCLLSQPPGPVAPLPVDYPEDLKANVEASGRTLWSSLSSGETRSLLHEAPQAYNTQINDLLLTALVQAVAEWTGSPPLRVDLEGHGREDIFEGVDLSRTVGWFTALVPMSLELEIGPAGPPPGEAIKSIKEQLRRIPSHGIGYGVLRHLSGDAGVVQKLRGLPEAEVSFNYLGQLDLTLPAGAPLERARESVGPLFGPRGRRAYLLDVTASVAEGRLQIAWTYSERLHRAETIESLARRHLEALRALIAHCLSPDAGGYTPSDFPEADLTQVELDRVLAGVELDDEGAE